jgi:lipoprotein NlpD
LNVRRAAALLAALFVSACATQTPQVPAPVVDRNVEHGGTAKARPKPAPVQNTTVPKPVSMPSPAVPADGDDRPGTYTVKRGDTLYSIALENGLDYKEIAAWNQIGPDYLIKVDQVLRLTPPDGEASGGGVVVRPLRPDGAAVTPIQTAKVETLNAPRGLKLSPGTDAATAARMAEGGAVSSEPKASPKPAESKVADAKPVEPVAGERTEGNEEIASWLWPTNGRVIAPFSDIIKGIDIAGKVGQPVLAAASGRVVYAGSGLRGYGKLIIIKHNKTYLTAYAHNSQLLVKEGDHVKRGDKIAEMGNTDADQVKLHFEIRRFGKPVDPMRYLTAEKS